MVKYTKLLAWQKKFSADINELGRTGYIRMAYEKKAVDQGLVNLFTTINKTIGRKKMKILTIKESLLRWKI